ncbi:hypothetical protein [Jongsikchunia kroppenstedtii]|uniref:hypothetical protein n=1 Tax=Jongsikchunia kroppenstedtii TaxID=1121721 RepID=UPI000366AB73|nr:hypothetical protein [Jongsikchunia kroppenstedtii]
MSMPTATSAPIACRSLTFDEADLAIDFVTPIVHEVPIFRWMLGVRVDEPDMVRLIAELLVAVALPRDRVVGAFIDNELVGLVVWAPPNRGVEDMPEPYRQRAIDALQADPGMAARMHQHQIAMAEHQPKGPYVEVLLAAIVPGRRGGDIVTTMIEPAFRSAAEHNVGVTATTASLELGAVMMRKYGAVRTDEFTVGPVGLNVYLVAPEDV